MNSHGNKVVEWPEFVCEMGTCPSNFDRENIACLGCRHLIPVDIPERTNCDPERTKRHGTHL